MASDTETFSWQTREDAPSKKTAQWYLVLTILTISIAAAAFILDNVLFMFLVLLIGFTLAIYGSRPPEKIMCEIGTRGIQINTRSYPYAELEAFGIDEEGERPKLLLQSRKRYMPLLVIPIPPEIDLDHLREALLTELDEEDLEEPLHYVLMQYLGI